MHRNALRTKALLAVIVPAFLIGVSFVNGADCHGDKTVAAGTGTHCNLNKNVAKSAEMTDDGAVVTLKGKNAEAVEHIKTHLQAHNKGETCPGCALSKEGVTAEVEITEDGGIIKAHGSSPETVKAVQEWAKMKDCCCSGKKAGDKA